MHVNLCLCVVSPILSSDNCCYVILQILVHALIRAYYHVSNRISTYAYWYIYITYIYIQCIYISVCVRENQLSVLWTFYEIFNCHSNSQTYHKCCTIFCVKVQKRKAEKNIKKIRKRRIYEIHRMPCRVSMIKCFLFEHYSLHCKFQKFLWLENCEGWIKSWSNKMKPQTATRSAKQLQQLTVKRQRQMQLA